MNALQKYIMNSSLKCAYQHIHYSSRFDLNVEHRVKQISFLCHFQCKIPNQLICLLSLTLHNIFFMHISNHIDQKSTGAVGSNPSLNFLKTFHFNSNEILINHFYLI